MLRTLLSMVAMTLLLGGCGGESRPSTTASPEASKQPAATPEKAAPNEQRPPVEKLAQEYCRTSPGTPAYRWPPGFKLPLDIHVEAPEVPKEIMGPSPPIQQNKEKKKEP